MNRKFGAANFLLFLWGFLATNLPTTSGDLTVIGDQNGVAETSKSLPDYWEQETSPEAIEQKRQQLLNETLGLEKFAGMRKALEAERERQKVLNPPPTPNHILLEVKLMEQMNKMSKSDAVPSHRVPAPQHINAPIDDMLYGGDMLLRNDQTQDIFEQNQQQPDEAASEHLHGPKRTKRQVVKGSLFPLNQWATSQPICFTFDNAITENTRRLVRLATQFWQDHTCVNFQEGCSWMPRVRVFKGQGCYSEVGRDIYAKEQQLSLGSGCEIFGTITHELGHVLGLYHHHSRTDRDNSINLIQENIAPDWRVQYVKAPADRSDNEGVTYDYASNMHYGGTDTDSEKIIMAAKHKRYQHTMGNNIGPIFTDLLAVNKYYNCLDNCRSGADCKNEGFRNPRDCQKCICPNGFGGDDCSERAPAENGPPADCGQTVDATSDAKELAGTVSPQVDAGRILSDKAAACHFHIKAPEGQRVQIELKELNGTCTPECYFGAIEIKLGDFTKGGIRVCCEKHMAEMGDSLISDGELAVVSIYSQREDRSFKLSYKATSDAATKDDDLLGSSASSSSSSSSSSAGSSSYGSLLTALTGILNKKTDCQDAYPTLCPNDFGKLICTMKAYAQSRCQMCKKSCQGCGC